MCGSDRPALLPGNGSDLAVAGSGTRSAGVLTGNCSPAVGNSVAALFVVRVNGNLDRIHEYIEIEVERKISAVFGCAVKCYAVDQLDSGVARFQIVVVIEGLCDTIVADRRPSLGRRSDIRKLDFDRDGLRCCSISNGELRICISPGQIRGIIESLSSGEELNITGLRCYRQIQIRGRIIGGGIFPISLS